MIRLGALAPPNHGKQYERIPGMTGGVDEGAHTPPNQGDW